MLCNITNNSASAQIVNHVNGRRIVLSSGETKNGVDLSERTIDRMRRGGVVKVVVTPTSQEEEQRKQDEAREAEQRQQEEQRKQDEAREAEQRQQEEEEQRQERLETETPNEKTELVRKYQAKEITFGEFQNQAKEMLGDKWPGGTPKRSVIIDLLQE